MNPSNIRVRRATLDDIGQLTAIWQSMHFPVEELARRITEFQVGEDGDGRVLGAIGLQIAEKQGLVHSEAFEDFAHAEELRARIWERLNAVATNHGLLRLWTREQAPFWSRCGLAMADAEALAKLPAVWRATVDGWRTMKLREDVEAILALDQEFSVFMQAEKDRTQRTLQQAKVLKYLATLIAFLVLGIAIAGIIVLIRKNPHILPH